MPFYAEEVMQALRARDAIKHEITAHEFGMHLCLMYGYDAATAVSVIKRCFAAGLIWIGRPRPSRGRPAHVLVTGLGRRILDFTAER